MFLDTIVFSMQSTNISFFPDIVLYVAALTFWRWEVCVIRHVPKSLIRIIFSNLSLHSKSSKWEPGKSQNFFGRFFSSVRTYLLGMKKVFHCSKCFQDRNDVKSCVMTLLLLLSRVISSPTQWCVLLHVKCVSSSSRVSKEMVHMLLSLEWIFSSHSYLQRWCEASKEICLI